MNESASALLVIDAQQSFERMDFWSEDYLQQYQSAQNDLIAHTRSRQWPVIFIFHVSRGPFSLASGLVTAMNGINRLPEDVVYYKRVHNALSESGLQTWLDHHGITRLIISGIRTEQCCETTARAARDSGFEVDFILDATLTFAMQDATGRQVSPDEIKSHTAMVLQQRFATVTDTKSFTKQLEAPSLNQLCPRSGKPVSADSIIDYRGYQVGFCNTACSSDFAANPAANSMDSLYFDRLIARHSARAAYLDAAKG